MTALQLLHAGRQQLAEVENGGAEALWMLEAATGKTQTQLLLARGDVPAAAETAYRALLLQRCAGVPVQYLLGSWEFCGLPFTVGPGVLIPRPETELLVDYAVQRLAAHPAPVVLDLCAGSGCIGLSVAGRLPQATVYLLEKSPEAFRYLEQNRAVLRMENAVLLQGDLLDGWEAFALPCADLLLSNPPYIATGEVETLAPEVQSEPRMALDGGEDGLRFYRAIAARWLPFCGEAAVEIGETQGAAVAALLQPIFSQVRVWKDGNGLPRMVTGTAPRGKG